MNICDRIQLVQSHTPMHQHSYSGTLTPLETNLYSLIPRPPFKEEEGLTSHTTGQLLLWIPLKAKPLKCLAGFSKLEGVLSRSVKVCMMSKAKWIAVRKPVQVR